MINQNIFVYSSKNAIKQKITATQADSGRVLVCNMADITVDASYTARIYAVKPSELKIYNDCTIVGNAVVVDLTTQILAEHGLVKCQIELADGEKKVTSFAFEIDVKETLVNANAIESTDEFTALEKALSEVGDIDAKFALKADLEQGKVPANQLPSYVDDVLEFASLSDFPIDGESGKIYIALDTNKTYRWSGSGYAEISESLALGETSSTAYSGDQGANNAKNIAINSNAIAELNNNLTTKQVEEIGDGYIRYADGTQICYGSTSTSLSSGVGSAVFAKPFSSIPIVICDPKVTNTSYIRLVNAHTITSTDTQLLGVSWVSESGNYFGGGNYNVSYMAIGRWK